MFDRIDPELLPFLDSEARQLLHGGQLSAEDHQALLDEAKNKRDASLSNLQSKESDQIKPWQETVKSETDRLVVHVGQQVKDAMHGDSKSVESPKDDDKTPVFLNEALLDLLGKIETLPPPLAEPAPSDRLSMAKQSIRHLLVRFLEWLRKWAVGAGLILLGASWTMIQIDEYALAGIALIAAMVAFSIQLYDWKGVVDHRKATYVVKGFGWFLIVMSFLFFAAVIIKKKGDKHWSNLQPEEQQTVSTGRPSATPTETNRSEFLPAPTPSVSAPRQPSQSPTPRIVRVNPSAPLLSVPRGFTPRPESAQLVIEGGKAQNVLAALRKQAGYEGPSSVLQFEVQNLSETGEKIYFGGPNVNDKTGFGFDDTRYWATVDLADLHFYYPKTSRVAVTFVWLREVRPRP